MWMIYRIRLFHVDYR